MEHERKVQTYQGWFLVLGIVVQIVLMGILVAFNFKNATTMAFVMKLNIWLGFMAAILGGVLMYIVRGYFSHIGEKYEVDENGYLPDYKIKGVRVVYLVQIDNLTSDIIVGVIFWALPFTGMIVKS